MAERLTEQDMREVLTRAEEIHLRSGAEGAWRHDVEAVLRAAEEAGLPREAVEKAIQERLGTPMTPPKVGERVFAKSADGKYYVAETLASGPDQVCVKFLKGGERSLPPEETRSAEFLPGEKVECPWPMWGWWTCSILHFSEPSQTLKVSDGWGSEETFHLRDVRLSPPRRFEHTWFGGIQARWRIYLLGVATGGLLGSVLTWLLTR